MIFENRSSSLSQGDHRLTTRDRRFKNVRLMARGYTRLTIFGHDFLRIRFIHLRLLRRRPFWAHGGKYLNQARILFVALF